MNVTQSPSIPEFQNIAAHSADPSAVQQFFAKQGLTYTPKPLYADRQLKVALDGCLGHLASLVLRQQNTPLEALYASIHARYASQVSRGQVASVGIAHINDRMGYGCFALENLSARTFIGEYTGVVTVTARAASSRYRVTLTPPAVVDPVTRRLGSDLHSLTVDAAQYGNEMRFINHAHYNSITEPGTQNARRTANVGWGYMFLDGGWRVFMVANRDIAAGEELRMHYGSNYIKSFLGNGDSEGAFSLGTHGLREFPVEVDPQSPVRPLPWDVVLPLNPRTP